MTRPLTITAYGNAQVDTAETKFGSGSLLLDGNGDYLSISNSSTDINITSDWCVECWIYIETSGGIEDGEILVGDNNAEGLSINHNNCRFIYQYTPGDNTFLFRCALRQVTGAIVSPATDGTITTGSLNVTLTPAQVVDAWHHVAWTRSGSTLKFYFDGVLKGTATSQSYTNLIVRQVNTYSDLLIGKNVITTTFWYKGWIDEFRISDTIRYTTGFTPSTTAFPPDDDTKLLIHFNGADASTTFTDDVGVQATATITATTTITATARADNPPMVYPYIIEYTWDDLDDSWDLWYVIDSNTNRDLWYIRDVPGVEFPPAVFGLSVASTMIDLGQSEIIAQIGLTAKGGIITDNAADLGLSFQQSTIGSAVRQSSPSLQTQSNIETTADLFLGGSTSLSSQFASAIKAGIIHDTDASLTTETSLTAAGRLLKLADIYIENFATVSASAGVTRNAQANLQGVFTQTQKAGLLVEVNEPYDYSWDSLPEDLWNGFPGDRWGPQGFLVFENLNLEANAGLGIPGAANLSSVVSIGIDAEVARSGSANLNTEFTISATAESVRPGQATISSQFALSVSADRLVNAVSQLAVTTAQTASAGIIHDAEANLQDNFGFAISATAVRQDALELTVQTLLDARAGIIHDAAFDEIFDFFQTAAAGITRNAAANLSILAFQVSDGESNPAIQSGIINLTSSLDLVTSAGIIHSAAAQLASEIDQSTKAGIIHDADAILESFGFLLSDSRLSDVRGSAEFGAAFDIDASGDLFVGGTATLQSFGFLLSDSRLSDVRGSAEFGAEFSLSTDAEIFVGGRANLESFGFLLSDSRLSDVRGSSDLNTEFSLDVSGGVILTTASAQLESFGFLLSDSRLSDVRGSSNIGLSFALAVIGDLALLESGDVIKVLSETRRSQVKSETRVLEVKR